MSAAISIRQLDQMPQKVQEAITSLLSRQELAVLSAVNKAVEKAIWSQVAKKLSLPVTPTPKDDIIAYYTQINSLILNDLDPQGHLIERNLNPILQHRNIEKALKEKEEQIYSQLSEIVGRCHLETKKMLMAHVPFYDIKYSILTSAVHCNSKEVIQILVDRGFRFSYTEITLAIENGYIDIACFLVKKVDVYYLRHLDLSNCPPEIRESCRLRGLTLSMPLMDESLAMKNREILQNLDPRQFFISRNANPYLQYQEIESYIRANANMLRMKLPNLLMPASFKTCKETVKALARIVPFEDSWVKTLALMRGDVEVIQILMARGVPFDSGDIITAFYQSFYEVAKYLAETVDKKHIAQSHFDHLTIGCHRFPDVIRVLAARGFSISQKGLDELTRNPNYAQQRAVVQELMSQQNSIEEPFDLEAETLD